MSSAQVQDDLIVFLGVRSSYPPSEDVEVRFKRKDKTTLNSRDWVGLFRVGWTSGRDYYTFEWAPMPVKKEDELSDFKLVFSSRRLPQDDGLIYQFCYINRDGTLYGSSPPFRFTKASNSSETVAVIDKCDESVTSDVGVAKEQPCGEPYRDEESDSLIVIKSLRRDLARSIEGRSVVEAECEKLRQRGISSMETLVMREREMQKTREQMEDLVKKLSGRIDQLEESLLEKQKLCVSDWERCNHQWASESSQLNQKLSECIAEVAILKDRLEHEGSLRKKLKQQLIAVEMLTKSMKSTTALQKEVHNIVSSFSEGVHDNTPTSASCVVHSAKSSECSAPSDVDHNALEALQLAYGTIEKYYHTTCAELEACQIKLKESENIVALLQQRCMELESQIMVKSKATVTPTRQTPSNSETLSVKDLEQRLEDSEHRCTMLTSSEEQYKRKIEELERQLHYEKMNVKMDSDLKAKGDTLVCSTDYEGVLQQLKDLAEILKSKKAECDIKYLLNTLEVVVAEIRSISEVNPDASNYGEASQAGFRQCPVCQLEFPQTMSQKKFERHIQKHQMK